MTARVKLQFRSAAYAGETTVTVVDEYMRGFHLLERAVQVAYYQLPTRIVVTVAVSVEPEETLIPYLELHDKDDVNRTYYFDDDDLRGPEWLKEFVVKAEIVEE